MSAQKNFEGDFSTPNEEMIKALNDKGEYTVSYNVVNAKNLRQIGFPRFKITKNDNTVGVATTGIKKIVNIYPNPTTDFVYVELSDSVDEIAVYNLLGRLVYSRKEINDSTVRLDFTDYLEGLYVVRVKKGTEFKTFKIIKN